MTIKLLLLLLFMLLLLLLMMMMMMIMMMMMTLLKRINISPKGINFCLNEIAVPLNNGYSVSNIAPHEVCQVQIAEKLQW